MFLYLSYFDELLVSYYSYLEKFGVLCCSFLTVILAMHIMLLNRAQLMSNKLKGLTRVGSKPSWIWIYAKSLQV